MKHNISNTIPFTTKVKRIGFAAMLTLGILGANVMFTSCEDSGEPDDPSQTVIDSKLIGTWGMTKYLDSPSSYSNLQAIEFNSDGTGKKGAYVLHKKEFSDPKDFNYSVSDNTITLNYIDAETGDETGETETCTYNFRGARVDFTFDGVTEEYMKL